MKITVKYNDKDNFDDLDLRYSRNSWDNVCGWSVTFGADCNLSVSIFIEVNENEFNGDNEYDVNFKNYEDIIDFIDYFLDRDTNLKIYGWYNEESKNILDTLNIKYHRKSSFNNVSEAYYEIEIKKYFEADEDYWRENNE